MKSADLSVPFANQATNGVIEEGCEFEGRLCFVGTMRINGIFRGEIFSPDVLVIGENAKIRAKIEVGVAMISGEVTGSIKAKHRVEIHRPAVFRGEIESPSLSVDEGVVFEGSTKMTSAKTN